MVLLRTGASHLLGHLSVHHLRCSANIFGPAVVLWAPEGNVAFTTTGPRSSSGQALIAVFSLLLAILIRRGLALSATGIVRRSTPSW